MKAYKEYMNKDESLCFWRTQTGDEVDFIIGDQIAIEVKSTSFVTERHTAGLMALKAEVPMMKQIIVSLDSEYRKLSDIEILPYSLFITKLWSGEIF